MSHITSVTSKLQLTLPVSVAQKLGITGGQKLIVTQKAGKIILTPMKSLIDELAGSLKVPAKWQGKAIDEMIQSAKAEHFQNKYK